MNDSSLKTLFHPFETGLLDPPEAGARTIVFNAPVDYPASARFGANATLVQDFRPVFLRLQAAGHNVAPEPEGEGYDLALVHAGRHRGLNELWIAEALKRVRPGGRIVAAGGRTDGAASLRKRLGALLAIEGHASKNHGVVFWLTRAEEAEMAAAALEAANSPLTLEGGFRTAPGLFSHERADAGSVLLAENLPASLGGRVADFGAGWGFLSVELARRAPAVTAIDLYEASFAACVYARRNMAALAPHVEAHVFWHDLVTEQPERRYDAVVMNPPFHQGRAAEPSLGEAMIRAASRALKPGGRLLLVANRALPYEAALQAGFARHGETCRDARFKVLWAVR